MKVDLFLMGDNRFRFFFIEGSIFILFFFLGLFFVIVIEDLLFIEKNICTCNNRLKFNFFNIKVK